MVQAPRAGGREADMVSSLRLLEEKNEGMRERREAEQARVRIHPGSAEAAELPWWWRLRGARRRKTEKG